MTFEKLEALAIATARGLAEIIGKALAPVRKTLADLAQRVDRQERHADSLESRLKALETKGDQ